MNFVILLIDMKELIWHWHILFLSSDFIISFHNLLYFSVVTSLEILTQIGGRCDFDDKISLLASATIQK